jgi:shikimate kinase/3-dehydroquinate synthase
LTRHIALVGFMGAGKTTIGEEVARKLGRYFRDVDREIEEDAEMSIPQMFELWGEAEFRRREEHWTSHALEYAEEPTVIALGGGAVMHPRTRELLREHAMTVWIDVDVETAWERAREGQRPLAREEEAFRRVYEERLPLYTDVADAVANDADDVVLAAARVRVEVGALELLGALVPGDGAVALVTDPHVAGIHGAATQLALGERLATTHQVPAGEEAKTTAVVERLWSELRLDRGGTLVAIGGGCVTDVAGFAAATYLRGIPWVAVPTSLVGQVDAAIGGKTAIDLQEGKNLVGAFHWPARTVVDPALLETLPERERREGLAEVVKTGLLAGEPLWELPQPELVRRSAAFKAAVCLRDPYDRGERHILNLGHTFAHALEAAASYEGVTHGTAVALGLCAALRLSGRPTDVVDELLSPKPVRVDRERAWRALGRDKKRGLVLLEEDGPRWDVQLPDDELRGALDELIADY